MNARDLFEVNQFEGELSTDRKRFTFATVFDTGRRTSAQSEWTVVVSLRREGGRDLVMRPEWCANGEMPGDISAVIRVLSRAKSTSQYRKTDETIVREGKNLGRANRTNQLIQALREAHAQRRRKVDTAGVPQTSADADGARIRPLPMLAQVAKLDKLLYEPAPHLQRKLDGVRAVSHIEDGEVVTYSRAAKPFPRQGPRAEARRGALLPLINRATEEWGAPVYLDGELYRHEARLQDIVGEARRDADPQAPLQYHIFDVFCPDRPELVWTERLRVLNLLPWGPAKAAGIHQVATKVVRSPAQLSEEYGKYLAAGYEGAMIRPATGTYQYGVRGYHCPDLLKVKEVGDGEFKLTAWSFGRRGKAAKALMLRCETAEGVAFDVTPAMPILEREKLAAKMNTKSALGGGTVWEREYLGRMLRVYYSILSRDGVPQQPRTGLELRDSH